MISALLHHYGRDDLPIGAYKGDGLDHSGQLSYVADLANNFPAPIKNSSQVPDAVDVYRSVLAAAPDRSVAISSIGLMTNLEMLLRSGPDQHSQLSGSELVAKKVKVLAAMAGGQAGALPSRLQIWKAMARSSRTAGMGTAAALVVVLLCMQQHSTTSKVSLRRLAVWGPASL